VLTFFWRKVCKFTLIISLLLLCTKVYGEVTPQLGEILVVNGQDSAMPGTSYYKGVVCGATTANSNPDERNGQDRTYSIAMLSSINNVPESIAPTCTPDKISYYTCKGSINPQTITYTCITKWQNCFDPTKASNFNRTPSNESKVYVGSDVVKGECSYQPVQMRIVNANLQGSTTVTESNYVCTATTPQVNTGPVTCIKTNDADCNAKTINWSVKNCDPTVDDYKCTICINGNCKKNTGCFYNVSGYIVCSDDTSGCMYNKTTGAPTGFNCSLSGGGMQIISGFSNYQKIFSSLGFNAVCKKALSAINSYGKTKTIASTAIGIVSGTGAFSGKVINDKINMQCRVSQDDNGLNKAGQLFISTTGTLFSPTNSSYQISQESESGNNLFRCIYGDGCFIWSGGSNDFLANTKYDNKLLFLKNLSNFPTNNIYDYIECKDGYLPQSNPDGTRIKVSCSAKVATSSSPSYFIKDPQPFEETCQKGCKQTNANKELKNTEYENKDYIGIIDQNNRTINCKDGYEVEANYDKPALPSNFNCVINDNGDFSSLSDDLDVGFIRNDSPNRKSCHFGYIETKSVEITSDGWLKTCESRVRPVQWDKSFLNVNVFDSVIVESISKEVAKKPACGFWDYVNPLKAPDCTQRALCETFTGCALTGSNLISPFYIGDDKMRYLTPLAPSHVTKTCTLTNANRKKIDVTTYTKKYCKDGYANKSVITDLFNYSGASKEQINRCNALMSTGISLVKYKSNLQQNINTLSTLKNNCYWTDSTLLTGSNGSLLDEPTSLDNFKFIIGVFLPQEKSGSVKYYPSPWTTITKYYSYLGKIESFNIGLITDYNRTLQKYCSSIPKDRSVGDYWPSDSNTKFDGVTLKTLLERYWQVQSDMQPVIDTLNEALEQADDVWGECLEFKANNNTFLCNTDNSTVSTTQSSGGSSAETKFAITCNNGIITGLQKCIPSYCNLPKTLNYKTTQVINGEQDVAIDCISGYSILPSRETGFLASCINGELSYKSKDGKSITNSEIKSYVCVKPCYTDVFKNIDSSTTKIYYNQDLLFKPDGTAAKEYLFEKQKVVVKCVDNKNTEFDSYEAFCTSNGTFDDYRGCGKTTIQCKGADGSVGSTNDFFAATSDSQTLASNQAYTIQCSDGYYSNTINSTLGTFSVRCLDGKLFKDVGGKLVDSLPKCIKKCKASSLSNFGNVDANLDGKPLNLNIDSPSIVDPFSKIKLTCQEFSGNEYGFVDSDGSYKKTVAATCKVNGTFGTIDFFGQPVCTKVGCPVSEITFVNTTSYPLSKDYTNSYTTNFHQLECPSGYERFMTPSKIPLCKNGKWIGDKILGCRPKEDPEDKKPQTGADFNKGLTLKININAVVNASLYGGTKVIDNNGNPTAFVKLKENESIVAKCNTDYYFATPDGQKSQTRTFTVSGGKIGFTSLDKCRRFLSIDRLAVSANINVYTKPSSTSQMVLVPKGTMVPAGTQLIVKCEPLDGSDMGFLGANSTQYHVTGLENGMFDNEYADCIKEYKQCSNASLATFIDSTSINMTDFNTMIAKVPYTQNRENVPLKANNGYNSPLQPVCQNGTWDRVAQAQLTKTPKPYRAFKNCTSDAFSGGYQDANKLFNKYTKPYEGTKITFMEGESIYLTCNTSSSDIIEHANDYFEECPNAKISGKCAASTCRNGVWSNKIECHKWIKIALGVLNRTNQPTNNIENKTQYSISNPIFIPKNSLAIASAMENSDSNNFDTYDDTIGYGTQRMYVNNNVQSDTFLDPRPTYTPPASLVPSITNWSIRAGDVSWCSSPPPQQGYYLMLNFGNSNQIVENLKTDYPNKIKDGDGESIYFSSLLLENNQINLRCNESNAYLALRASRFSSHEVGFARYAAAGSYCAFGGCFDYDAREFRTILDSVSIVPDKQNETFQLTPNISSYYTDGHIYASKVAHLLYVHCLDSRYWTDRTFSNFVGYYKCNDVKENNASSWGVGYTGSYTNGYISEWS
jgi:hypothetical protein